MKLTLLNIFVIELHATIQWVSLGRLKVRAHITGAHIRRYVVRRDTANFSKMFKFLNNDLYGRSCGRTP